MSEHRRNRAWGAIFWGLLAGAVNGLLGAGGGILLVRRAPKLLPEASRGPRDVFATALFVMLPVSAVSALTYALRGSLSFSALGGVRWAVLAGSGIAGGAAGALLLDRADVRVLRLIFAAVTVWSGLRMVWG